jgi:outer membrane protein OmpA-like peptidoglycan-associated protein
LAPRGDVVKKSDVIRRCFLVLALVAATGNAGCAGRKTHLHAEAVSARGVRVSPSDVFTNSSVLVVKVNVINDAGSPITLDTDAVRLTLADGRVLSPSSHARGAKTIGARESELVRVDFRSDGFKWKDVTRAQLNVSGAVLVHGSPTPIPPMELTLGDLRALAVVENKRITIAEQIQFRTDSAEIVPESEEIVIAVAEILSSTPKITRVRIEGHTDDRGDAVANLELSKRRAASVVAALAARGVSKTRLKSAGFGETKPLDANTSDDGRRRNRRVEFHIED